MIKKNRLISRESLLLTFLLLFFLSEAWSVLQIGFEAEKSSVPKILKILSLLVLSFYLILKKKKKALYLTAIVTCFMVGLIGLENGLNINTFTSFSKYLFFLILLAFFSSNYLTRINRVTLIFKIFEALILINCLIVISSYIFEIQMFLTYGTHRFGYIGLFYASATGSYFYIFAISYLLIRYDINVIRQPLFYIAVLSALLLGTKSLYLFLVVALIAFSLFQLKSVILKKTIIFAIFLASILILYLLFTKGIFAEIVAKEGWLTSILSYRDQLILDRSIPYIQHNWQWHNYLFGGLSVVTARPQMELIDLFMFFGMLGLFYYIFLIKKFYFDFRLKSKFIVTLLICVLVVMLIAGNFFYNASVPIYLIILKLAIINSQEKLSDTEEYSYF